MWLECVSSSCKRNTYVRMLFIDYSSAFNTIVPSKLVIKTLGLDPARATGYWTS
jgi:hypothetical protein